MRCGTASRVMANNVNLQNSTATQRIATAFGTVGHLKITERPITQHGISGLSTSARLSTGANRNRQIKDKRYWLAMLQTKIQEINQEMDKIGWEKRVFDRERSARKLYEKKAKEAAKELTNLQSTLTSMNLALDNCKLSGMTRQHLFTETIVVRERNEHIQEQLEHIFKQRQFKDGENRDLENATLKEKNKIIEMIRSLPLDEQNRYQEFQTLSDSLRKQNSIYHTQINDTGQQKERMNSLITNSQSRAESHQMKLKIKDLVTKRNTMRHEENHLLTPAQEREQLINEVRSNNVALGSIGKQLKIIGDQHHEKKEKLLQTEHDLEEGSLDRHTKYKELKKRDEVMSTFMDNFDRNMEEENQNLVMLKNQITYFIEQITLQGINMNALNVEGFTSRNDLNSRTGLLKEYKKLSIQLKQLQIIEKRTCKQVNALRQEEDNAMHDAQKYTNLEAPRSEAIVKMNDLSIELQELDDKQRVTENVVVNARRRNQEVKLNLKGSETYRQIAHLEEKLVDLLKEIKSLHSTVDQMQQENHYSTIREDVHDLINEHNRLLSKES